LAKTIAEKHPTAIEDLKGELNALPEAKDIALDEKKAELAKLEKSFKQAQVQKDLGSESDPLTTLLGQFCDEEGGKLEELQTESIQTDAKLKELAAWFAEKPTASASDLFLPLATFVKDLGKAHQDNKREDEAEKRKVNAAKANWQRAGSSKDVLAAKPPMPPPGGVNMAQMLELNQKLAKRAEKAAMDSGAQTTVIDREQRQLLANKRASTLAMPMSPGGPPRVVAPEGGSSVGEGLSTSAGDGTLFLQRRQQQLRDGGSARMG